MAQHTKEFFSYKVVATILVNPYFKQEFRLEFAFLIKRKWSRCLPWDQTPQWREEGKIRVK